MKLNAKKMEMSKRTFRDMMCNCIAKKMEMSYSFLIFLWNYGKYTNYEN